MNLRAHFDDYKSTNILKNETLIENLYKQVEIRPNKTAVIDKKQKLTYKELFEKVKTFAKVFQNIPLSKKDRVMIQLPNSIEFIAVLFACNLLELEPVLMLPTHRHSEITTIAQILKPKVYVGTTNYLGFNFCEMVEENLDSLDFIDCIVADKDFKSTEVSYLNLDDYKFENYDLNAPKSFGGSIGAYILTGGTTSMPKIIPKINEAYVYNIKKAIERCHFNEGTIYLAVLSIAHDYPLANPGVLGTLFSGGTVIFAETTSFDEAFHWINKERVNTTSVVPAVIEMWAENYDWFPGDLTSLKHVLIGAAQIDIEKLSKIEKQFGVTIQQGYGLGEGITCFTQLNDPPEIRLGTQGKPISEHDQIKIIDSNRKLLNPLEIGEIAEKGPYTFKGYFANENLNSKVFTKDGYFLTGDLGYIDLTGNLVIAGRVDDQINRLGENILPKEVEAILKEYKYIKNCAVLGVDDEELGQKTCACIEKTDHLFTIQDLRDFFEDKGVARFKVPDEIYFVDKLPYSNIGKIDKKKLSEIFNKD